MPPKHPVLDRLTGQDLGMLGSQRYGWPQDIGAIAVLAGDGLFDAGGGLRIEAVRAAVARRLPLLPRLRQVVCRPRLGLGRPLWVDVDSLDLAHHVRVQPLPPPADEAQLLATCETLRRRPFDPGRPLWELWLLPGLADRQVGMYLKLHHVIADGAAGVALAGTLLDPVPRPPEPVASTWTPRPAPSARVLLADNLRRRLSSLAAGLRRVAHPVVTARELRRFWPALREVMAEERAPRTSLNRPIGKARRTALVRGDLGAAKAAARAADAKVNDVVLAAVAGGLRELLRSRGEPVDDLVLRVAVPMSLHGTQPGEARGNLDAAMAVRLPLGEADGVARLRQIAADTARRKRKPRSAVFANLFGSPVGQRLGMRFMDRQRLVNVYVANVVGPGVPLYLAGARLLEVFAVVPILGNVTLGVGVLSYAGQLNFTVIADAQHCADLPVFVDGLRGSLHEVAGIISPAR